MNRREWYLLAALVALLIFPTRALAQQRPNVLLILVDDLNHFVGRGGNYSQAKTPYIDRLAQTGVQFLKAHANYPVCNPSRVSLFHDLCPWAAKIMFWETWYQEPVSQNNQTLVQLLRENGYTTDGTGKLMHKERPDQFDVHQLSGPNYVPSL
jgi:arylsulfatase A-like enzyme